MNKIIFLILFICLCCNTNSPKIVKLSGSVQDVNMLIIDIDHKKALKADKLSDVIDTSTLKIIPLETTERSLISNVDFLKIQNDTIYILNSSQNTLFIFGPDGKFLNKLDKQGRGIGEYHRLGDYIVKNDSILILDHDKLIFYNKHTLDLIKTVYLRDHGFSGIAMYFHDHHYYFTTSNLSQIEGNILVCDESFNLKHVYKTVDYNVQTLSRYPFFKIENDVFYYKLLNDTIYKVSLEGLKTSLSFNSNGKALNFKEFENLPKSNGFKQPIIPKDRYVYSNIHCSDNTILFIWVFEKQLYMTLINYSKKTLSTFTMKNAQDDIINGNGYLQVIGVDDEYFYGMIQSIDLFNNYKNPGNKLSALNPDDNPIILKFKFNDFN